MESCNNRPRQVLVLNIGDELLDGLRENGHLVWLGEQLARRGLPITRSLIVRDKAQEIAETLAAAWGQYDLIVTTGGIGPTSDDHTRGSVAAALGVKLKHVPEAEAALRERFQLIGRKVAPADLSQCAVPEGGESLPNARGNTLYKFWDDEVAKYLNKRVKADGSGIVINCASQEYFGVVNTRKLKAQVIECAFLDYKNGDYKTISFFAKRARGLLARFAITHQLEAPEQLKDFDVDGYRFHAKSSSAERLVFRRKI